ncbi:glutamate ABC transporter substrate-binding protein [Microlunatus panaciterrae]|uniref:Polar amino acid transport system substrate-binding protein n=1 Tax=Microlunatus panaciterrae TaxID=400768 RepID=A0ABS2RET6_9ACTN|nr:glutamate ABC transporter substrate-binding protein [Microlunatus panaciterrae]MBM7797518.1 polar amino acid transport system substrate-binding protein [Microlunatus panaciterrae]
MTTGRSSRLRRLLSGTVLLAALLSGCSAGYAPTPIPRPTPSSEAPSGGGGQAPVKCSNPLVSYRPEGTLPAPGKMPAGSTMRKIQQRGRLIAGVSADTYLLGSRNPLSGRIEGFDIDLVKAVAKAIFGDENAYELKVITAAQRIGALQDGTVDIVARNMTINCDRWTQIAFSTEYYRSGQKFLVRRGSKAKSITDLSGQKVCAPKGTSSMDNLIKLAPKAIPVGADTHTGCLVMFQQGDVTAITGDDTVLAGLAAQDPYAEVPAQKAFTAEPYGIGVNKEQVDLVRFINQVLERMRTDGEWTRIYNTWLSGPLGKAPKPPAAQYGRTP